VFDMMWWNGPWTGWGSLLMGVGMLLFLAVLVLGVGALVHYLTSSGSRFDQERPSPEELLAERFARGEIDEREYRQRLDTLHGTGSSQL
jgi:putative membrane protein